MTFDRFGSSSATSDFSDIVTVRSPDRDLTVAIVGMCHLGSVRYYDSIWRIAEQSDAVLYELTSLKPRKEWGLADYCNAGHALPDFVPRIAERMTALRMREFRELH